MDKKVTQFATTPVPGSSLRDKLTRVRLSLGGALVGLSVAGIISNLAGIDRARPDWIGAVIGGLLAFTALGNRPPSWPGHQSR